MLKLPGNLFGSFDFDECGTKKFQITPEIRTAILPPGHTRMAENGWFKDHAERGTLVRLMYVIDHNANLAQVKQIDSSRTTCLGEKRLFGLFFGQGQRFHVTRERR
jgi:hypothetical protein